VRKMRPNLLLNFLYGSRDDHRIVNKLVFLCGNGRTTYVRERMCIVTLTPEFKSHHPMLPAEIFFAGDFKGSMRDVVIGCSLRNMGYVVTSFID
jgi:hypothetical protein